MSRELIVSIDMSASARPNPIRLLSIVVHAIQVMIVPDSCGPRLGLTPPSLVGRLPSQLIMPIERDSSQLFDSASARTSGTRRWRCES